MTDLQTPAPSESPVRPGISFVIPARNEERLLAATLQSIRAAANAQSVGCEIIVVNDASTDRTAEIAAAAGARVVDVALHNIAAVRNAGAELAQAPLLVFLDADTLLPSETLAAIRQAVADGAVGGGARVRFEGVTWLQLQLIRLFLFAWQDLCGWATGCCVWVSRDLFREIGGFDPVYFAAEERYISSAIRARGPFRIVEPPVLTSGRKLRLYSTAQLIGIALRTLALKGTRLKSRKGLEILYDAPREASDAACSATETTGS